MLAQHFEAEAACNSKKKFLLYNFLVAWEWQVDFFTQAALGNIAVLSGRTAACCSVHNCKICSTVPAFELWSNLCSTQETLLWLLKPREWHVKAGEAQWACTGFLPYLKLILTRAENLRSISKQKCTAVRVIILHKWLIHNIKILWSWRGVPPNSQGTSTAALFLCGWSVFSRTDIQPSMARSIGSFLQNVLLNRNHSIYSF